MMRRTTQTALAALLVALTLTACGQTQADVERDGKFAKACHAHGGRVWYDGANQIACDFTDASDHHSE